MAEQSSTITMFRALVMLICLALVPLAAISGTSFPAVVKAIQNGRMPTLADFRAGNGSPQKNLTEAPRYDPSRPASIAANTLPSTGSDLRSQSASVRTPQSNQPYFAAAQRTSSGESAVVPVSFTAPVPTEQSRLADQSTSFPQDRVLQKGNSSAGANQGTPLVTASNEDIRYAGRDGANGLNEGAPNQFPAGNPQPSRPGQLAPDALFKQVQDRLKQLGATYYLLEAWGDHGEGYRFLCRMSIGGNPHVTKSFEHVDGDPLGAMTRVLQMVEEWQKGTTGSPSVLTTGSMTDLR
jgi:hypothetical protein